MFLINYISQFSALIGWMFCPLADKSRLQSHTAGISDEHVSSQDDEAPVWWYSDFYPRCVLLHLHAVTCHCLRAVETHAGWGDVPHCNSPGKKYN